MEIICNCVEDTYKLAKTLADTLVGGEVILLNGELGAGKTTFTKGLAEGLNITKTVTSPTFIIMKEYKGRLSLYHFDMYRIADPSETYELGFDEYLFAEDGVCVIEWNKFDLDSKNTITITISSLGSSVRKFIIEGSLL